MDATSVEQNFKHIYSLLLQKRLKEALVLMDSQPQTAKDYSLRAAIDQVATSYGYMLDYMSHGVADPERHKLYGDLLLQTLHLADLQRMNLLMECGGRHSFDIRRNLERNSAGTSLIAMRQKSEDFAAKMETMALSNGSRRQATALIEQHDRDAAILFDAIWTDYDWDAAQAADAAAFLDTGNAVYDNDLCLMTSAVTMSVMDSYDKRKIEWLLQACRYEADNRVALRALIGLVFTIYIYTDRILLDHELCNSISFLADSTKDLEHRLYLIYIQLLHCQDTENVNRKIRDEIMPEIIKATRDMHGMDIDPDDDEDSEDPTWDKVSRDTLAQMNEMQEAGDDINISTFSMLKRFPWFNDIHAWFMPFDINNGQLMKADSTGLFGIVQLRSLIGMEYFCDSDKYSFALLILNMPEQQRTAIAQQMLGQLTSEALEAMKEDCVQASQDTKYIIRSYMQDLYRFLKLFKFKEQFHDVFADVTDLHRNVLLRPYMAISSSLIPIADYRFTHGRYAEAHAIYRDIIPDEGASSDMLQHDGFCLQKQGMYAEAIDQYYKADSLSPGNRWTLRNMAFCYRRSGDYKRALSCYKTLEAAAPQDTKTAMHIGRCLYSLGRYDEALQYFYKVQLTDENDTNACRAIAWCSLLTDREAQSLRYYDKVLEATPTATDYMNAGHANWCFGHTLQATQLYCKALAMYNSADNFRRDFMADKDVLQGRGICADDIPLMLDIVSAKN